MPIYRKDGAEYELPVDFDTETGVDRNREKALAKGYTVAIDVRKPDSDQSYTIPETDIDKAMSKGYVLAETQQSLSEINAKPETSLGEKIVTKTVDKVGQAIPQTLGAVNDAATFTNRAIMGDVGPQEAIERAGTAIHKGLDFVQGVGSLPSRVIRGALGMEQVDTSDATAKLVENVSPEEADRMRAQAEKYPGAGAVGEMVAAAPFAAVGGLPGMTLAGGVVSAGSRAANQQNVEVDDVISDTLAGVAPVATAKGVTGATRTVGAGVDKIGRSLAGEVGEKYIDKPMLQKEMLGAADDVDNLTKKRDDTLNKVKKNGEAFRIDTEIQLADLNNKAIELKQAQDAQIRARKAGVKTEIQAAEANLAAKQTEYDAAQTAMMNERRSAVRGVNSEIKDSLKTTFDERQTLTDNMQDFLSTAEKEQLLSLKDKVREILYKSDPTLRNENKVEMVEAALNDNILDNIPKGQTVEMLNDMANNAINAVYGEGGNKNNSVKIQLADAVRETRNKLSPEYGEISGRYSQTKTKQDALRERLMQKKTAPGKAGKGYRPKPNLAPLQSVDGDLGGISPRLAEIEAAQAAQQQTLDSGIKGAQSGIMSLKDRLRGVRPEVTKEFQPQFNKINAQKQMTEIPEFRQQMMSVVDDIKSEYNPQIEQKQSMVADLNMLKKPASPVSKNVAGYAGAVIGGAAGSILGPIGGGAGALAGAAAGRSLAGNVTGMTGIKISEAVRKFNKPTLTAAVKFLEKMGRTLNQATIQELARQHDVDEKELTNSIQEGQGIVPP